MYLAYSERDIPLPVNSWQQFRDWSRKKRRCRHFAKDKPIPVKPGLLYIVYEGVVRIVGNPPCIQAPVNLGANLGEDLEQLSSSGSEETIVGFAANRQPFELTTHFPHTMNCIAHVENTTVIWLHWAELEQWPSFRQEVLAAFQHQYQRKLFWLNVLGQRRTLDRLHGFLTLLIEDYGEPCPQGYYLPFSLTHAQIGNAINSTRVTITRLMGELRRYGLIHAHGDYICLPRENHLELQKEPKVRLMSPKKKKAALSC